MFKTTLRIVGRILLAQIFIVSGILKILDYHGMMGYMQAYGLPGQLLPAVIALEIVGGFALLFGRFVRPAAFLLGLFSIAAALIFHHDLASSTQRILLMSDLAFAGGLLYLAGS